MSHDQEQAPEVEEGENQTEGDEQPLLCFQTLGRRYKRKTPYPKPRPYDRAKDRGEYGDPAEMQAVFDSRAAYFQDNPKPETLQEVATDSRDLMTVLKDFPGAHDFVLEMETVRMKALDRLELLNRTGRELAKTTRELEAVAGEQPQLRARVRELETQTARENISAAGSATVEDLRRLYGFKSKQGVTKHLRRLQEDSQIANSKAGKFHGAELKIIQAELSRSERTSRGKVKKNAS